MSGRSGAVTLIEDWQARRQRLAGKSLPQGQYVALQIQILDYLAERYRDAPEAGQPAACPVRPDLFVNDRAIVVHDHLWEGKVGGAKTRQEAERRVSSVLKRMASDQECPGESAQEDLEQGEEEYLGRHIEQDDAEIQPLEERPRAGSLRRPFLASWDLLRMDVVDLWRMLCRRLTQSSRLERIEAALQANPLLPTAKIEYLYSRLANPDRDVPVAVDLLGRCANRSMLTCAALAWRQRVAAGRDDPTTRKLRELFSRPDLRKDAVEKIGVMLADRDARVRLEAIDAFGSIGSLEHVGMLSDLLNLPPQPDEDPRERDALIRAMQSISQKGDEGEAASGP